MSEENELPEGWVQTTLEEVTAPIRVSVQPREYPTLPFIGMEHVESETMRLLGSVPASELKSNAVRFWPGDVLYGRLRPYLNKVLRPDFEGLCSAEFLVFRESSNLDSHYLQYFLNSWNFRGFASHLNEGDRPRVDWSQLKDFRFPLPPLPEQHRIVAAIEQQFTRLDAGVAALQRARIKLKRCRAAVLKAAVEGKLTEAWRAEQPTTEPASMLLERILKERRAKWEADLRAKGKDPAKGRYVEPAVPDVEGLSELPEGWCWTTVEQVGNVQLGRQRAPQHHNGKFMRPYLRVANVFEARIDTSDILTMNFTPEEFETYRLKFGDILLNEGQSLELIGRSAIYRDEVPGACFQNTLVRFRAYPPLLPEYALTVFRVYLHTHRFQRIGKHTTNIAHLGAGRFAVLEFPVPPFTEQEQIVSEVERHLSLISQLETAVEANLKRAQRLRQGILHEAFAGRLVAQDPNDEPASVLLERIRSERGSREQKNGTGVSKGDKGRAVKVPEPGVLEVMGTEQVELWENVGG